MQYRCEATSLEGFIQQLGNGYLRHGYRFWRSGTIPEKKDPEAVDRKLMELHDVAPYRQARHVRKRQGYENAHYIRHDRFWVLLATSRDVFQEHERHLVKDAYEGRPIKYGGYSVSFRQGRLHVRIEMERYRELKAYFLEIAPHRSPEKLAMEFYRVPFEPWAPIRWQLRAILDAVNRIRRRAGFKRIPYEVLPARRRSFKVFEPIDQELEDAA